MPIPRATGYDASKVDMYTANTNNGVWGWTTIYPGPNSSCSGCTISYSTTVVNYYTLKNESAFTRSKVAAHEFGHAFGLAHPHIWDTAIMEQGHLSFNTPRSHDINDVNIEYPY